VSLIKKEVRKIWTSVQTIWSILTMTYSWSHQLVPCGGKKRNSGDLKVKSASSVESTTFQNLKKNYDLQQKFYNEWEAKEP